MDVFRVFDALNDIRNLHRALKAVRRTGKHAEGTICYTISPLHTVDKFVEMAQQLRDLGCDSICIKDMAAPAQPQPAYDIVRGIKEACGEDTLVHVHVHSTTGVTMVSLMKAIEAGADIVDTAISSLSLGPGHNPTEALVEMLEGTGLHHPAQQGPAAEDQGPFRQGPAALRRVRVEVHRRRDRDLRQPDSRRHDLQHGEPAQAAGGRRPREGGARRGARRSARTPAIRRWSRRRARSSARRRSSTC